MNLIENALQEKIERLRSELAAYEAELNRLKRERSSGVKQFIGRGITLLEESASQSVKDLIRVAIADAPEVFGYRDIENYVVTRKPSVNKGTLRVSFVRMVREGEGFERIQAGGGNKPAIYKKRPVKSA